MANDMDAEVKQAFLLRPHLVDNAAGFVRMDVLSPEDMPNEIWLITYSRGSRAAISTNFFNPANRGLSEQKTSSERPSTCS